MKSIEGDEISNREVRVVYINTGYSAYQIVRDMDFYVTLMLAESIAAWWWEESPEQLHTKDELEWMILEIMATDSLEEEEDRRTDKEIREMEKNLEKARKRRKDILQVDACNLKDNHIKRILTL